MTGVPVTPHPAGGDFHEIEFVRPLPCPPELCPRFQRLPQAEIELVRPFIRKRDGSVYVQGTTWLAEEICLGTANIDSLWTQRRPLIAYWRTAEDTALVLRLRFLKDGRDFASMYVVNAQKRNRALSAVAVAAQMGDFHLFLDAPAEGIFTATDLRLRYELSGKGARAAAVGGIFELAAGGWRGRITPLAGRFAGAPLCWESGGAEDRAWVDAVCYQGVSRSFSLKACGDLVLAAGLELLRASEEPKTAVPVLLEAGGRIRVEWEGLVVELPLGLAPPPVDTSIYRD
jgi:hypothetical protein